MKLNSEVGFTWLGHGTWQAQSVAGRKLLLEAFVKSNPATPERLKKIDKADIVVITHGHGDHTADLVEIAKATKPTILCPNEIGHWLATQGIEEKVVAFAKGGTVEVEGITFTMVHAEHFSSMPDGSYAGEPVGYVITFENGFKIYFAGDTDVFGDMALIRELDAPEVAFLPIGDFYTMGPRRAAKAVELLGVKTVVPMHYGTMPALHGRPDQLQKLVGPGVKVVDIQPGDSI
ncbi:MAG: metal-dependent hydrolase [Candidatus Dormibacteraceae bacterium]